MRDVTDDNISAASNAGDAITRKWPARAANRCGGPWPARINVGLYNGGCRPISPSGRNPLFFPLSDRQPGGCVRVENVLPLLCCAKRTSVAFRLRGNCLGRPEHRDLL